MDKWNSHELGGLRPAPNIPVHLVTLVTGGGGGCSVPREMTKKTRQEREQGKQHPEQAAGHRLFLHFLGAARTTWVDKRKSYELGGLRPLSFWSWAVVVASQGKWRRKPGKKGRRQEREVAKQHPEQAAGHRLFLHFFVSLVLVIRTTWIDRRKSWRLVILVLGGGWGAPGK